MLFYSGFWCCSFAVIIHCLCFFNNCCTFSDVCINSASIEWQSEETCAVCPIAYISIIMCVDSVQCIIYSISSSGYLISGWLIPLSMPLPSPKAVIKSLHPFRTDRVAVGRSGLTSRVNTDP